MNRYERLQRHRLEQQQSTSDSGIMSDVVSISPASCETIESTSPLEECRLEAASSSTSQDASVSELENEETSDAIGESDDVMTEDIVEVENLDFSDETIAECTPAAEENDCADNDMTSPLSSSTTPAIVDQESLCDLTHLQSKQLTQRIVLSHGWNC